MEKQNNLVLVAGSLRVVRDQAHQYDPDLAAALELIARQVERIAAMSIGSVDTT